MEIFKIKKTVEDGRTVYHLNNKQTGLVAGGLFLAGGLYMLGAIRLIARIQAG